MDDWNFNACLILIKMDIISVLFKNIEQLAMFYENKTYIKYSLQNLLGSTKQ